MLDSKSFAIGKNTFVIQPIAAMKGLEYATTIAKMLSGGLQGVHDKKIKDGQFDLSPSEVVKGIVQQFDPETTPQLIKGLVQDSLLQPHFTETFFDSHFASNYSELLELLEQIYILNFKEVAEIIGKKSLNLYGFSSETKEERK